jgi:hypothetical protein
MFNACILLREYNYKFHRQRNYKINLCVNHNTWGLPYKGRNM